MLVLLTIGGLMSAAGAIWSAVRESSPEVIALRGLQIQEETKQLAIRSATPPRTLSQVIGGWLGRGAPNSAATPSPARSTTQTTQIPQEQNLILIAALDCGTADCNTIQERIIPAGSTVLISGKGMARIRLKGQVTGMDGQSFYIQTRAGEGTFYRCSDMETSVNPPANTEERPDSPEECIVWANTYRNRPLDIAVGKTGGDNGEIRIISK
jgi:hypothetical protein